MIAHFFTPARLLRFLRLLRLLILSLIFSQVSIFLQSGDYGALTYIRSESEHIAKVNTSKLVVGLLVCVAAMTVWSAMNDKIGYFTEKTAWEYCNPLVIMTAVCAFLLFKRIKIKNSKFINSLAKGSFTVYLIHINLVTHVGVKLFVNNNIFILILHMALSSALIYFVCWIVYLIYSKLEKAAFGYIKKKIKLPLIEI